METLTKWMDLLDMQYKHKIFILSWISNCAIIYGEDTWTFLECANELLMFLEMDKKPNDNMLDLIEYINALKYIDIAKGGLQYREGVKTIKRNKVV